ncbi:hypothetical protein KEJ51_05425 [Candidatus Bathyarchaeota archaeon]|nr:hypothetical protein [Candidatus Bathyarchaeota archaeon]MBS7629894.1 hypothetical protein [Candidatus Bathyarchaeota archaeon]
MGLRGYVLKVILATLCGLILVTSILGFQTMRGQPTFLTVTSPGEKVSPEKFEYRVFAGRVYAPLIVGFLAAALAYGLASRRFS